MGKKQPQVLRLASLAQDDRICGDLKREPPTLVHFSRNLRRDSAAQEYKIGFGFQLRILALYDIEGEAGEGCFFVAGLHVEAG